MKFKTNNNSYSENSSSNNENTTPSKRKKLKAIINSLSPKFYYINHLGEIIVSKNFK